MAAQLDLPRLEDILPGLALNVPDSAFARPAAPAAPAPDPYTLLTPRERAQVDLYMKPRSALGEIGTGVERGALYELPNMIAQGLRATGKQGDTLFDAGQSLGNAIAPNDLKYMLDENPQAHNVVTRAAAQGAAMLAPSLAPLALAPLTGGGSLGLAAAGAAGAGLFGASQFQDTYEKAKAAGLSDEDAFAAGAKTGTIEAAGETIGTVAGGLFLKGAGKLGMRLLGRQATVPEALSAIRNPNFLKEFGKDLATTAAVETGTEMGQNFGEAAVEKQAGIDKTDPWDAATSAIGPTLAMTAMLGPFGAHSLRRQQRGNQFLLDTVESGNAPLPAVNDAAQQLATQIEPLVGKDQAQQWRLDALANANAQASDASARQDQATLDEQVANRPAPEPLALPAPNQPAGLIGDRTATEFDTATADANAAQVYAARDAEEARQTQLRTEQALVNNRPTDSLSFADFTKQALKSRPGELAKGGRITQDGLKQAYMRYLTDLGAQQPSTQAVANTQEQLDLGHPNAEPARPNTQTQTPEAPAPTAMQIAMERAQRMAQTDQAFTQREQGQAVVKAIETERLQRVAKANALADDALAGKINGNTPVAGEDLQRAFHQAAGEAGIDTSVLKGQNAKKLDLALKTAEGKTLWVQQLNALRKARDGMKGGTVLRDSMDAFVSKLENFNGVQTTDAATGQASQGAEPQSAASQAVAALSRSDEQSAKGASETVSNVRQDAQQGQVAQAQALQPTQVTQNATDTGQRAASSVGQYQDRTGGGQVTIASSSDSLVQQQTDAARDAQAEKAGVEPYHFESYPYNPDEPRGGRGSNAQWTDSFERALRDAAGLSENGAVLKRTEAVTRRMTYAKEALASLVDSEREGPNIFEAGKTRIEELAKIRAQEGAMGAVMRARANELREQLKREIAKSRIADLKAQVASNTMQPGNRATRRSTAQAQAELERLTNDAIANDPESHSIQAEGLAYGYDPDIHAALSHGDLNLVLTHIVENGPSEWARSMAGLLRGMDLGTKIEFVNEVGASERGNRTYGSYNHTANRVRIFIGGTNAHTVLHEVVHAATIGHLAMALEASKVAEGTRTADQRAAVADLAQLRRLIGSVRFYDTEKQYAFTNEAEFIAETLSNEKFQNWLHEQPFEDRSLWDKIKEWFAGVLNVFTPGDVNALEASMYVGMRFLTGERAGAITGDMFHSPASALDGVNRTGQALNSKMQRLLENSDLLANTPGHLRAGLLQLGSTFHIQKWIERIPALQGLVPGIKQFFSADGVKTSLLRAKRSEFYKVARQVQLALAGVPNAERRKMMNKLTVVLEASRLNVDLNKNFDQNLKGNSKLDPALRSYVNDLHQQWLALPDKFKRPLEDSVRVNRKNYIQTTAALLATHLRTYKGLIGSPFESLLAKLDILAPDLQLGTNTKPGYYHDAYSANLDRKLNEVFIALASSSVAPDLKADFAEIKGFYQSAVANPYQHLGRTGDHFVEFDLARNPGALAKVQATLDRFNKVLGQPNAGNNHVFLRFENQAQMLAAHNELAALGADAVMPKTLDGGNLYDASAEARMQGVPAFIRRALAKVDSDLAAKSVVVDPAVMEQVRESLKRVYLDALPDSSAQKALARRKEGGVIGYDADFVRSFSHRAEGMASMLANAYTMPLYDAAFDQIKQHVDTLGKSDPQAQGHAMAIYQEIAKRFANSLNPVVSPVVDRVKAFGYNFYLAMSPAFWLTNLSQPYLITLPTLGGRYGFVRTAREMGKATAAALRIVRDTLQSGAAEGSEAGGIRGATLGVLDADLLADKAGLTPGQSAFVARLLASGQLDNTQGQQLGQFAKGTPEGLSTTAKLLSVGSHYTEVVNRLTAGLAAYNLELARGKDEEGATQRGIEAVRATQFDYSDHNTARALGRHGVAGQVTPLLASFQQFSFQSTELLLRMVRDATLRGVANAEDRKAAQKGLLGVLGTTTLLAGTLGLPAANVVARVFDALIGSDDDPSDVKTAYRAWLADVLGKDAGEALARGLPRALLGFDTSQRAGFADVIPGSRFLTDRRALKDQLNDGAFNLLGPAVSAGRDLTVGIGHMLDGQIIDGLTEALPLALRGPAKALKLETSGYTNATGNKLPLEATGWDEFVQSIGFTPSKKAEQSEANFAFKTRDALLKQQKSQLSNQFYLAVEGGADTTDIMQKVREFNEKNPQYAIHPQQALRARAKGRAVAEMSGTGIETLPRYLPLLDRYSFANTR